MRVLLLSPYDRPINPFDGDQYTWIGGADADDMPEPYHFEWADIVISYGYRHIIKSDMVAAMEGKIVNVHTSLLPWNRGAHSNFWSFYDNSPNGVTVHFIDEGVDTGDIIASEQIIFSPECETLATSYRTLNVSAEMLFARMWPTIRKGTTGLRQDLNAGSSHKKKDLEAIWPLLSQGWQTTVTEVMELGRKERERSGKSNRNLDQVRVG